MSSEKAQRRVVVDALRSLDAHAVENRVGMGTPDVNFVEGWIELKSIELPSDEHAPLGIRHFTPQQRVWLDRRWRKGGNVWMLLKVGPRWLLFEGSAAAKRVGRVSLADLGKEAYKVWWRGLDKLELNALMRGGRDLHRQLILGDSK